MARKPDKHGSPYDPANRKPHPKFPDRYTEITMPIIPEYVGIYSLDEGALTKSLQEALARSGRGFKWGVIHGEGAGSPTRAGPPPSYHAARKAVEAWLVTAPAESALDDVIGHDEALAQLRSAIEAPVKDKELYEAYGLKLPKGALLSGPPGCGKTLFARSAAAELARLYEAEEAELICVSGGELQSMHVGETQKNIKAIYTYAREYHAHHGRPLLVFIDEADAILPDRTGRVRGVTWFEEQQVSAFLAELDGVVASGAFTLLASNRPEAIDQAVLRDGRCDIKVVLGRPTQEAVEAIIRKNFGGKIRIAEPLDSLVMAAVESLYDPHRVLVEAHAVKLALTEAGAPEIINRHDQHMTMEWIVSGAMAAGLPQRAAWVAFGRDKAAGTLTGVTTADVVAAVDVLFNENKGLVHGFALEAFKSDFMKNAQAKTDDAPTIPPTRLN